MDKTLVWLGIGFCLSQSAIFSGLTIGFFGLSRLQLEVKAEMGGRNAIRILALRKDANFLLATLLWGNVAVNVLLTLLTESVLTGIGAFAFSTVGITTLGEIVPQAYFSRHALRSGAMLVPFVHFYQTLLFPLAKPTALLLDKWLGKEGVRYFQENEIEVLLRHHASASETDLGVLESIGAANFLGLDDVLVENEGEKVHPKSVIKLKANEGNPIFPDFARDPKDDFLRKVAASGEKWVIITDLKDNPIRVLDADHFLREAVYSDKNMNPYHYCHKPVIVSNAGIKLGNVLRHLKVDAEHKEDDVIDHDLILYWTEGHKRVITGSDLLGRLLRGIVKIV